MATWTYVSTAASTGAFVNSFSTYVVYTINGVSTANEDAALVTNFDVEVNPMMLNWAVSNQNMYTVGGVVNFDFQYGGTVPFTTPEVVFTVTDNNEPGSPESTDTPAFPGSGA
jgi:hypothetical protein